MSIGSPVAVQPASGVSVPKPHMLMIQSAPATALSRSGGTEYASDSTKHTA